MSPEKPESKPPVTFTLDGVEYTSDERSMSASEVLRRFGGLDPANYDLIRIVGNGNEKRYDDAEEVQLVPHGKYVSFFTGSMPVE